MEREAGTRVEKEGSRDSGGGVERVGTREGGRAERKSEGRGRRKAQFPCPFDL